MLKTKPLHLIFVAILAAIFLPACDAYEDTDPSVEMSDMDADLELEVEALAASQSTASWPPALTSVASFNPALGETPESVAVTSGNELLISMALTGEIRKIDAEGVQSTLAYIPLGPPELCQGPFPGIMGALAVDPWDNVYVGASACDPANKGVWRVSPSGTAQLIASLPPEVLPNGIAYRLGQLYVADSASTRIWRAPANGSGAPAEVWVEEPLLADPNPLDVIPGANGLQFFNGSVYVANAGAGTVVEIPFNVSVFPLRLTPEEGVVRYGPASSDPVVETPPEFPGCDDFAFDVLGGLWCTTDPFQSVWRLSPLGNAQEVWTAADGLDGPTAACFGRGGDRKVLYLSNAQFPFFPPTGNGPSVLKASLPIAGYPLR